MVRGLDPGGTSGRDGQPDEDARDQLEESDPGSGNGNDTGEPDDLGNGITSGGGDVTTGEDGTPNDWPGSSDDGDGGGSSGPPVGGVTSGDGDRATSPDDGSEESSSDAGGGRDTGSRGGDRDDAAGGAGGGGAEGGETSQPLTVARNPFEQQLAEQVASDYDDYGAGDFRIERTDDGFSAQLRQSAFQREAAEQAGVDPDDIFVQETGEGYQAQFTEEYQESQAIEDALASFRSDQRPVEGLDPGRAVDDFGQSITEDDLSAELEDGEVSVSVDETFQEDVLREQVASQSDAISPEDVVVEETDDGSLQARPDPSVVETELREQVAAQSDDVDPEDVEVTRRGGEWQASATPGGDAEDDSGMLDGFSLDFETNPEQLLRLGDDQTEPVVEVDASAPDAVEDVVADYQSSTPRDYVPQEYFTGYELASFFAENPGTFRDFGEEATPTVDPSEIGARDVVPAEAQAAAGFAGFAAENPDLARQFGVESTPTVDPSEVGVRDVVPTEAQVAANLTGAAIENPEATQAITDRDAGDGQGDDFTLRDLAPPEAQAAFGLGSAAAANPDLVQQGAVGVADDVVTETGDWVQDAPERAADAIADADARDVVPIEAQVAAGLGGNVVENPDTTRRVGSALTGLEEPSDFLPAEAEAFATLGEFAVDNPEAARQAGVDITPTYEVPEMDLRDFVPTEAQFAFGLGSAAVENPDATQSVAELLGEEVETDADAEADEFAAGYPQGAEAGQQYVDEEALTAGAAVGSTRRPPGGVPGVLVRRSPVGAPARQGARITARGLAAAGILGGAAVTVDAAREELEPPEDETSNEVEIGMPFIEEELEVGEPFRQEVEVPEDRTVVDASELGIPEDVLTSGEVDIVGEDGIEVTDDGDVIIPAGTTQVAAQNRYEDEEEEEEDEDDEEDEEEEEYGYEGDVPEEFIPEETIVIGEVPNEATEDAEAEAEAEAEEDAEDDLEEELEELFEQLQGEDAAWPDETETTSEFDERPDTADGDAAGSAGMFSPSEIGDMLFPTEEIGGVPDEDTDMFAGDDLDDAFDTSLGGPQTDTEEFLGPAEDTDEATDVFEADAFDTMLEADQQLATDVDDAFEDAFAQEEAVQLDDIFEDAYGDGTGRSGRPTTPVPFPEFDGGDEWGFEFDVTGEEAVFGSGIMSGEEAFEASNTGDVFDAGDDWDMGDTGGGNGWGMDAGDDWNFDAGGDDWDMDFGGDGDSSDWGLDAGDDWDW